MANPDFDAVIGEAGVEIEEVLEYFDDETDTWVAPDLTGYTVRFYARNNVSSTAIIDGAATAVNATLARFKYVFTEADLDTAFEGYYRWEATSGDDSIVRKFPTGPRGKSIRVSADAT